MTKQKALSDSRQRPRINPELWSRFRAIAVMQHTSAAKLLEEVIRDYVDGREKTNLDT